VDAASIEAAIRLVTWFKYETRRIYGRLAESEDTRDTRKILECVQAKGGRVTVRDVAKAGLCHGDAARITDILNKLAEAGRGVWRDVNPTDRGGRRTRSFELSGDSDTTGETGETPDSSTPPHPRNPQNRRNLPERGEVSPVSPVSGVDPQGRIEEGTL
jgi:hypothetical protein